MIKKDDWFEYIDLINRGRYKITFEYVKKKDRRVYILDLVYGRVVASCSYQAYRKYRKYLHLVPGE